MAMSQVAFDDGVLRITCTGPAALAIAGDIDEATHAALASTLRELTQGQPDVQIDLGAVTYCDLAGMRAILLLGAPGRPDDPPRAARLALRDVPEQLLTILHILGWDAAPGLTITPG
jgi:ABC-type transporter Mla MlaB component